MIDLINIAVALLTIAFGAFGFIAPRFTLGALSLQTTDTNMGLSEMRASVGGLFVALGTLLLIWPDPMLFVATGVAIGGAAIGRFVSLVFDSPPVKKVLLYGGIEAAMAAWLLLANL